MAPTRTALLLALGLLSCRRTRSTDPVILALGDQMVRKSDFDRHVKALETRGEAAVTPAVREELLEPFLEDRILVLEARARGLLGSPATAEEEDAAVQKLLASAVSPAQAGEDEIAAYFLEHAAEFRLPETVTVRQILVPTPNEARDVRRRLQKDPKSFEALARSRSRAPEGKDGGLMGTFSRGQLPPELEGPAFALPPGGASEIVETPLGYHVLRVEARQPARDAALEESRDRIRTALSRQKADRSVRQFVRSLMARAKVNHEAAIARPGRL